jgi:NAD(P)-dependent dehydrogenase (short-subunit alcohol dehydrogenase family)
MSLKNKLALVTGAASGIGFAIAELFAQEAATVIAVDVQEAVSESIKSFDTSHGQQHSAFVCDVSKSESVSELFTKISEMYHVQKVPNVIVNCAGIGDGSKFVDTSEEVFDRIINVNLKGPFLISRAAARELIKHYPEASLKPLETYASIINISSIAGKCSFPANHAVYSATKSGLDAMTRVMAYELAEHKIRVNSLAPGPIRTPMNDPAVKPIAKVHAEMTYMKRFGEASEVAQSCVFLASDNSSYVTGTSLDCNGGFI